MEPFLPTKVTLQARVILGELTSKNLAIGVSGDSREIDHLREVEMEVFTKGQGESR